MSKLLIVGDSFSENSTDKSWTTMLDLPTVNLSNCGISEYRIAQKLAAVNFDDYSHIIVNHTSPNRLYIPENPYYTNNETYRYCDLIYNDIKSRNDKFAKNVAWWFENVFDLKQAEFMHRLLINHIVQTVPNRAIHITFFDIQQDPLISLHQLWTENPGTINHLNEPGNVKVAEYIKTLL